MTCIEARKCLLTGQPSPEIDQHLAGCPACRQEQTQWQRFRELLDAAPVPPVLVDVPRLYAEADRQRRRQLGRWRQAAFACAVVAAVLLLVIGLKLQVRTEAGAITFRWGEVLPPKAPVPMPPRVVTLPAPPAAVTAEDMQLANDLIHALAARVDSLDERERRTATALALRLQALAQRTQNWQAAQQQRTAYHLPEDQALEHGE